MSAICHSVNAIHPTDTCELHNLPMVITVKCRKDRNTDDIVNDIGGYEARCAAKTAAAQAKPASSPAPHGERPAWMRNIGTHEILELIKLQIAIGLRQAGISV